MSVLSTCSLLPGQMVRKNDTKLNWVRGGRGDCWGTKESTNLTVVVMGSDRSHR